MSDRQNPAICVAIPCFNEEQTVGKVISDFRRELPEADIVVFDNNSVDHTADVAREHGAEVIRERLQGKGFVVQAIFQKIRSDVIVIVDGDDTYPAEEVHTVLKPILDGEADMAVGSRLEQADTNAFRFLHRFGNRMLTGLLNWSFNARFQDILSGYRAFNRRFVQTVPLITPGFEIETELTLQAVAHNMLVKEVPIKYRNRPEGSESKLRSFSDGYRILMTIAVLLRDRRPLFVFSSIALVFAAIALMGFLLDVTNVFAGRVVLTRWVRIAAEWCLSASALSIFSGLILNAINTRFREMRSVTQRNAK